MNDGGLGNTPTLTFPNSDGIRAGNSFSALTTRISVQYGHLKEINPEYSLEGLILKLKLQYFGHLMWRNNSLKRPWCWERLRAEGEEGVRRWDGWMASLIQWTWTWANFKRWWGIGRPCVLQSMGLQRVRHDWAAEQNQHKSKPSNKILKTMILTCTVFRNSWSIRKQCQMIFRKRQFLMKDLLGLVFPDPLNLSMWVVSSSIQWNKIQNQVYQV